jgi:hypothetical protein
MSRIRPLERADVTAVAALYQRRARSAAQPPPAPLAPYIERMCLDAPWVDEEIPSLVCEKPDGEIVGFIASNPRRYRADSRAIRVGCSGPMVADEAHPGVGVMLTRAYMRGPQDLTLTDGASDLMHQLWTTLRGRVNTAASFGWLKLLRPGRTLSSVMLHRGRPLPTPVNRALAVVDRPMRRVPKVRNRLTPWPVDGLVAEPLTVDALLEQMSSASRHWRLHPDYDASYLRWLFDELDVVTPRRGRVVRHLVRSAKGRVLGWYVYFLSPRFIAQVQQIAAPGGDPGPVIDHLVAHADANGAVAVAGRMEPGLAGAVRQRRFLIEPTSWSLVQSDDTAVLGLLDSAQALLTRLDGEWWMGHHVLWQEEHP